MNILDPQGPVGAAQKAILLGSVGIMLAIVIPTIIAILAFAFWFRASNAKAEYRPDWAYSGRIELVVWSIPTLTIILLGGVAWIGAHDLDPAKPLDSSRPPLEIQVVSLDWKWLFVYPDQKVATINTLTVPVGVPLKFTLTSASVMNAFFIPQFGSMIYTMNGMTTQLNLQADNTGDFRGLSSHFSGDGFAEMGFAVRVVSDADFATWTQQSARSDNALNAETYGELAKPSTGNATAIYRLDDPHLFQAIATQAIPPAPGPKPEGGKEKVSPTQTSSPAPNAGGHQHVR